MLLCPKYSVPTPPYDCNATAIRSLYIFYIDYFAGVSYGLHEMHSPLASYAWLHGLRCLVLPHGPISLHQTTNTWVSSTVFFCSPTGRHADFF